MMDFKYFWCWAGKEDWAYLNWKYPTEPSLNLNKGWQHIGCKSSEWNYLGFINSLRICLLTKLLWYPNCFVAFISIFSFILFKKKSKNTLCNNFQIYFIFLVSHFYFAVSSDCKNKYLTWSNSYLNISMEIFKFVVKE